MKGLQDPIRRAAAALALVFCAACGGTAGTDAAGPGDPAAPAGGQPSAQEPVRTAPPALERIGPPERPSLRRDRDVDARPPLFDERRPPELRRDDRPPQMRVA